MSSVAEVTPVLGGSGISCIEREASLTAARVGFWAALVLAVLTPLTFAIAIATPPRSGPFCTGRCFAYPYMGAVEFVPRDFLWCYPAAFMLPIFVVAIACLRFVVPPAKRPFGLVALCFACIAAAIISVDYFLQIEVVQPSLLRGESNGLAILSQYNPHGIFIALEDFGYLVLSAAFLFAGLALSSSTRLERVLRWTLMATFVLAFGGYIWMAWRFGANLEMRFELLAITIDWTVLTVAGVMLAALYRRARRIFAC